MTKPAVVRDLAEIRTTDTLTVLSEYNSTSYFLYKGEPMGYEFEALRSFANELGLTLRMVVAADRDTLLNMLNRGEGDIVAARIFPEPGDTARVAFTGPLYQVSPVLVQRGASTASPVNTASDLARRTVHLPENSSYEQLLVEVADSATGEVRVVGVDSSSEALIRNVAKGKFEYTVADSNLAAISATYYPQIVIRPVLGDPSGVAWAVRKNAPQLRAELDRWIAANPNKLSRGLYVKYFIDRKGYRERLASPYMTSETGNLSQYDLILQRYASSINWDWRLLASQAYQESRFKPTAKSFMGAVGLLQLMPATAKGLGVRNRTDPDENVRGAVKFLSDLTRFWTSRIPDPTERMKFVLASYNAGIGHVADAQRLAERAGDDPKKWDDVAVWLLKTGDYAKRKDPAVRYGWVRGEEPVKYVSIIFERWQHYKSAPEPTRRVSAGEVDRTPPPEVEPAPPPAAGPPKPGRILERQGSGRLLPKKQIERKRPAARPAPRSSPRGATRNKPKPATKGRQAPRRSAQATTKAPPPANVTIPRIIVP